MGALVFLLIVIIVFLLLANFGDSKKETTREKIGDAVTKTAYDAADTVADISHKLITLTEPEEKKKKRQAIELLDHYNWVLSRCEHNHSDDLDRLLKVSDNLRDSLSILGLKEDEWRVYAEDMFYRSKILEYSFLNDKIDKKIETDKRTRESIVNNEIRYSTNWGVIHDDLMKALHHFDIDPNEWIEYGYAVLPMYRICDDEFHKKFQV